MSRFARFVLPLGALFLATGALAQDSTPENWCDEPGEAPNVIVGDIHEIRRWGKVGDIIAFSIGTTSCNLGTCWLNWITGNDADQHPVIGGNAFRLENGRMEQLGQSWLKHGFYALSQDVCSPDCLPTDGEHLGVNCSDPYSADLNATQRRLGPKFEVDVSKGHHPHPVTDQGLEGDAIFKRLQIHEADLDETLHPTARYFVEAQYVTEDDAAAGNHHDNGSYREVQRYRRGSGNLDMRLLGSMPTHRQRVAVHAWQDNDPNVMVESVLDGSGGMYYVASLATQNPDNTWHYEYAVQNFDSTRAAESFDVPIPTRSPVYNKAFHDVEYHSGEPFALADWQSVASPSSVEWYTDSFSSDPNANALRWGTLYNFRFDSDHPPGIALVTLGMFKPGSAGTANRLGVRAVVPGAPRACDGDGLCDAGEEDCVSCAAECSGTGPDIDGDGVGFCVDCNDNLPGAWGGTGEVPLVYAHLDPSGDTLLDWTVEDPTGGNPTRYEVLGATNPADFVASSRCLRDADPTRRTLTDVGSVAMTEALYYLVRAIDPCSGMAATTGTDSFGAGRTTATCP
jgi:hypothetical protein